VILPASGRESAPSSRETAIVLPVPRAGIPDQAEIRYDSDNRVFHLSHFRAIRFYLSVVVTATLNS
jgi:hypothetical protein